MNRRELFALPLALLGFTAPAEAAPVAKATKALDVQFGDISIMLNDVGFDEVKWRSCMREMLEDL